jgi:hypothetical protein
MQPLKLEKLFHYIQVPLRIWRVSISQNTLAKLSLDAAASDEKVVCAQTLFLKLRVYLHIHKKTIHEEYAYGKNWS